MYKEKVGGEFVISFGGTNLIFGTWNILQTDAE